jgi:hypothetical protein
MRGSSCDRYLRGVQRVIAEVDVNCDQMHGVIGQPGPLRIARLGVATAMLMALVVGLNATALAAVGAATKVVRYHGYRVSVPAVWPVYDLATDPSACVRFNRHALYLGSPSARQRCPAGAIGRTEAILVSPLTARYAGTGGGGPALPPVTHPAAQPDQGSEARFTLAGQGVTVTATWNRHPGVIQHALGARLLGGARAGAAFVARLPALRAVSAAAPAHAAAAASAHAVSAAASVHAAAIYTGLGFDACSTPSPSQMLAWGASPYRALGVYVGGVNMACSQNNLTAAWVSAESAAGWQLIPTYVGLQAPTNSCGCAGIVPSQAAAEGSAAAADAVTQAQAVGIDQGNPIYDDMEAYPRTPANTLAVMTFLSAWTTGLHAAGYQSGIYGSAGSGISDLVAQYGTGFAEPDDIWDANWNGQRSTADPTYLPAADWAAHQRLHQYDGAHNEKYGGVTINIDGDYVDGATAGAGQGAAVPVPTVAPAPALTLSPHVDGSITLNAGWSGATGVAGWQVLAGSSPAALTPLGSVSSAGANATITVHDAFPYFAVQGLGSTGLALGTSPAVATPPDVAIYGHSAFVSSPGIGGVPVGCLTAAACQIAGTVTAGGATIATTGLEWMPAGGGVLYFALSTAGRRLLARSGTRRLPVVIAAHSAGGPTVTSTVNLIPFITSGRGPRRALHAAPALRLVGATDFVFAGLTGGLLAGCSGNASCMIQTSIRAGNTTIATGGPERLGANELGYLMFKLTAPGRAILAAASGNQLGVYATVSQPGATAHAALALVGFR